MKRLRVGRLVLALIVVSALVLAVWAVGERAWDTKPSISDVAGVWQRGTSNMRITIYPSGDVTFSNVPKGIVDEQGDKHDNTSDPITVSGKLDPFWNYGWWGGVSAGYSLSDGKDGGIDSDGNALSGYRLSLSGGDDEQYHYDFHRISSKP